MAPKAKKASAESMDSTSSAGGSGRATQCGERDVLLGRGKSISEWPGNIYFRQVVNKYRHEYILCSRKEKVQVANSVLEEITAIGGRFMHQLKFDKWEEVDYERAIEKACQALREKEPARPPEISPFTKNKNGSSVVMKPPKAPPTIRPVASQRRPAKTVLAMKKQTGKLKSKNEASSGVDRSNGVDRGNRRQEGQSTSTEESTSADESGNEEKSGEEESDSEVESSEVMPSPRALPDERMYPLLEVFVKKHGHCAVPPWDYLRSSSKNKAIRAVVNDAMMNDDEQALANWCSAQRQIYREIQLEYREGTSAEKDRIKKLTMLGFVWDYEAWHWEQSFEFVQNETNKVAETKQGLSDESLLWIREQRRRGKRGMAQDPDERAKKLKSIDVLVI